MIEEFNIDNANTFEKVQKIMSDAVIGLKNAGQYNGVKNILTKLYPDKAHFIYELLQNAEDAIATEVDFGVYVDRFEFQHNGKIQFELDNIKSICSIGNSTKTDGKTNIGKFGVGFKSVYAYCKTPEIYTDKYNFKIEDMLIPKRIEPNLIRKQGWTKFVFPFDESIKGANNAIFQIENGLKDLKAETVLFLNNIKSINYTTSSDQCGIIEKKEIDGITFIDSLFDTRECANTHAWIKFNKTIEIPDQSEVKKIYISLAYALENNNKNDSDDDSMCNTSKWKIVPVEGETNIYFPAKSEISNLKFSINAPFASTVARDKINEENSGNDRILQELAKLMGESMFKIKKLDMLDKNIFNVIPNSYDDLSNRYKCFYDEAVRIFSTECLLPTINGKYEYKENILFGNRDARKLFTGDDIKYLYKNKEIEFLDSVPVADVNSNKRSRAYNFLKELNLKKITPEEIIILLSQDEELSNAFFKKKDNNWLYKSYTYLLSGIQSLSKWDSYNHEKDVIKFLNELIILKFKGIKLIRTTNFTMESCDIVKFVDSKSITISEKYKQVHPELYINQKEDEENKKTPAREFLEKLGVSVYGLEDIEKENYQIERDKVYLAIENKTFDNAISLMKTIIRYTNSPAQKSCPLNIFDKKILLSENKNDEAISFTTIDSCCIDSPYLETGFVDIAKIIEKNIISAQYFIELNELELQSFKDLLYANNVFKSFKIEEISCKDNKLLSFQQYEIEMSSRYTTSYDRDFSIKLLDKILGLKSEKISCNLWKFLINTHTHYSEARFQMNRTRDMKKCDSQLLQILKNYEWVPTVTGIFKKPADVSRNEMLPNFSIPSDSVFLRIIAFETNFIKEMDLQNKTLEQKEHEDAIQRKFLKEQGFNSIDDLNDIKAKANTLEEAEKMGIDIKALVAERKCSFVPLAAAPNSQRRLEKQTASNKTVNNKTYIAKTILFRKGNNEIKTKAKTELKSYYTDEYDRMHCQVCGQVMPFKKNDGDYYFETIELDDSKNNRFKETSHHYIACCPLCAAKIEVFVKNDKEQLNRVLDELEIYSEFCLESSENQLINIQLDDSRKGKIEFCQKHLIGIKSSNKNIF